MGNLQTKNRKLNTQGYQTSLNSSKTPSSKQTAKVWLIRKSSQTELLIIEEYIIFQKSQLKHICTRMTSNETLKDALEGLSELVVTETSNPSLAEILAEVLDVEQSRSAFASMSRKLPLKTHKKQGSDGCELLSFMHVSHNSLVSSKDRGCDAPPLDDNNDTIADSFKLDLNADESDLEDHRKTNSFLCPTSLSTGFKKHIWEKIKKPKSEGSTVSG